MSSELFNRNIFDVKEEEKNVNNESSHNDSSNQSENLFKRKPDLKKVHTSEYHFIVWAPPYSDNSSGIRALHRLCHLLNSAGYNAAIAAQGSISRYTNPLWETPVWSGTVAPKNSVVIYPEVFHGKPIKAQKVVRWVLNYTGKIGRKKTFAKDEMVFVWDRRMLNEIQKTTKEILDDSRELQIPVINPEFIYYDKNIEKNIDCYFIYKGKKNHQQFKLPNEKSMICIDKCAPSQRHLGDLLRRTRNLYSYDHATILFHEALICGCKIFAVHEDGSVRDPRICDMYAMPCSHSVTTSWPVVDYIHKYTKMWSDPKPVHCFAEKVFTKWPIK